MAGEIRVKVRNGLSRDPRYESYPYWYLEVIGDDNTMTEITPSYQQLKDMLIAVFKHEQYVDKTRNRKPNATKWMNFINEVLLEAKQSALTTDKDGKLE